MPNPLTLTLTQEQRRDLEKVRDSDPKAYKRERAAALLKIADGASAHQVAQSGLLRGRKQQTVCGWVHRYKEEGLAGLSIQQGRGRKPAFFP